MQRSTYKLFCYFLPVGILTLIAALLRILCYLLAFDTEIGYYQSGAALPVFLHVFEALCVIFCFALPLYIKKEEIMLKKRKIDLCGKTVFALLALTLFLFFIQVAHTGEKRGAPAFLPVLLIPFLLVGIFYYLLPLFTKKQEIRIPFGCALVLALVFSVAFLYFDRYVAANSPIKTGIQLALLTCFLYVLYELRLAADIAMPRVLICMSALCVFACATVGLSDFILFLSGRFTDALYLLPDIFLLIFAVSVGTQAVKDAFLAAEAKQEKSDV